MRTERFQTYTFPGIPFHPLLILGSFLMLMFVSCEDDPGLSGRELLPSGDNFLVSFDSMELVHGYTRLPDSVRAGYKTYYLLGSIIDPFFGSSRAELVTTVSSSINSKGFGPNAEADSVILYISPEEWIGEGIAPIGLHLYEYTEFIQYDSIYFSNMDINGKFRETEIGSAMAYWGDTIIKIPITDQEFIDKFLGAEDSILSESNYIQELMYGIYLKTDDPGDEGSLLRFDFDLANNYLYFYYHNDTIDSLNQYYNLDNSTNGRINLFTHDYSGSPLEEYLQNGSNNDSLMFVQSMGGVSSVIHFPELNHWMDSMPVAINEARVIIPIADSGTTMQQSKYYPESIALYLINADGSFAQVYDNILDPENFGGEFDAASGTYSFSVKVQVQSILAGNVDNLEMILVPENASISVTRAGLYGWNARDPGKRIRLEIIYTLL